jgi:hypothetical protein
VRGRSLKQSQDERLNPSPGSNFECEVLATLSHKGRGSFI